MADPETESQQRDRALTLVFAELSPRDLVRCCAVSKLWLSVAREPEVRREVFIRWWGVGGLVNDPQKNPTLFETATLRTFTLKHVVQRIDTLQALAVRYGVTVTAIKQMNNIISDTSLHSRHAVFLPVLSPDLLLGKHIMFEFCTVIRREFAVVLSTEEAEQARLTSSTIPPSCSNEQLQAKLCALMGRSLRIDEATARFYLNEARGDVKQAMELYERDMAWENGKPRGLLCHKRCTRGRGGAGIVAMS